ncbi:CHAT domain-containing protein [Streptomyces sp. NPDC002845]
MTEERTGADLLLQLAEQYAVTGNARMEAECRYQRAQNLRRNRKTAERIKNFGDISSLNELRKERAVEYERAAELFGSVGSMAEAGRCWYRAASEYNYLFPPREYREKCYSTCRTAAECFGAAGDWWGVGVAECLAGGTLQADMPGDLPDPRSIPAFQRAATAFTRADRPVDAAGAEMMTAVRLTQVDGEEWLAAAVQALHAYEQARPSLRMPKDREINDQTIVANGARVLTSKVRETAVFMSHHPAWRELIWLLNEAPKARSFQDQHIQGDTWSRLVADDNTLSELMTRRKALEQEQTDLAHMIKGKLAARLLTAEDEAQARTELRRLEKELENVDRKVARRFRGISHDTPERTELLSTSPVAPESLQLCLKPGEAYISYRWHDGAPLRSVVTHSNVTADIVVGVTSGFATAAVAAARNGKVLPLDDAPEVSQLIGQVPADVDTLIISPDSLLLGVPWPQLPNPANPELTLGESYTIAVIPAAGVLHHLRARRPRAEHDAAYLGVACDGGDYADGPLLFVDQEVGKTWRDHFADTSSSCLLSTDCDRFLVHGCSAGLLHLACHAEPNGLLLSRNGSWTRPTDLLSTPVRSFSADILLLTGCSAGDFSQEENNEFLGVVRQLIVVTGAQAAVVSMAPVPDPAGVLFADLFVSALNGRSPDRPWQAPDRPLTVGAAVTWAQQTMRRRIRVEDAKSLIDDCRLPQPAHPSWWSPWFVVGDPGATTRRPSPD